MRNDSAAAIALNRSGFLGGSLDWDFNGVGRGPDDAELAATNKPVTLPAVNYPTSANNRNSNLNQNRQSAAIASSSGVPPQAATGDEGSASPDSPDYSLVTNDAIVVYNERTAL